jgi:putative transposase
MANTYSQISIHGVFAVRNRSNFIIKDWRDELHKYIAGTINDIGAKSLAVGGWLDHVHVLFGPKTSMSVADVLEKIKAASSNWIKRQKFVKDQFQWQSGYGAFSYSKSQRDGVINYIMAQEDHHKKTTFKEEYLQLLNEFDVEFDQKYLFEFYD